MCEKDSQWWCENYENKYVLVLKNKKSLLESKYERIRTKFVC